MPPVVFGIQSEHPLQDPGAGEASSGAQRLHDQPGQTGQPAQPCKDGLAQPEAQDAQVGPVGKNAVTQGVNDFLIIHPRMCCHGDKTADLWD